MRKLPWAHRKLSVIDELYTLSGLSQHMWRVPRAEPILLMWAVFPSDISPRTSTIRLSDIFSRSVYLCPTWLCVPHQHFSTNSSLAWLLLSQLPCPTACNDHSLCNNSVANGFTCSMGLASVLNGYKRCFCYIIVHLTVQLCCIVKLFYMFHLQKVLKQIGGLVFLAFLGDRHNVSGWGQPNMFKKTDGKDREPIALIVIPYLRDFRSVFFFIIFTCETRQKKKVWGSDFFYYYLWNLSEKTDIFFCLRWNKCFFLISRVKLIAFFSLPCFTHEEKILLWKMITWGKNYPEKKFFTCPQGSCRSLWLALAFLAPNNHLKSVKHQGLLAWVSFPSCWL